MINRNCLGKHEIVRGVPNELAIGRIGNHSAVYILFWSFEISDNILRNQK